MSTPTPAERPASTSTIRSGIASDLVQRSAEAVVRAQRARRPDPAPAAHETAPAQHPAAAPAPTTGASTTLRRPIRGLARVAKHVVRPVASRTRRYLVGQVHSDLWMELQLKGNHLEWLNSQLRADIATAEEDRHAIERDHTRALADLAHLVAATQSQMLALRSRHDDLHGRFDQHAEAQTKAQAEVSRDLARLIAIAEGTVQTTATTRSLTEELARRIVIPAGNDTLLVRAQFGYILCPISDLAALTCMVDSGDIELGTRLLIERTLKPGDTFVDAGANLGFHTLAAARVMNGEGRIIAIEPFGPTADLLRRSIVFNGRDAMCEVHEVALSHVDGSATLHLGPMSGHHSLVDLAGSDGTVIVKMVRLDELLAPGTRVDLLKIDVEGFELEVIAGAERVIADNPGLAMIAEFGPSHLERTGHTCDEWLAAFRSVGFEAQRIDPTTGELLDLDEATLPDVYSVNLLWTRPQKPPKPGRKRR